MGKSRFIELMVKSIDGSASAEELVELQYFLDQNAEYGELKHLTDRLSTTLTTASAELKDDDIKKGIDSIWNNIEKSQVRGLGYTGTVRRIYKYRWSAAAAIFLLLTLITALIVKQYIPGQRGTESVVSQFSLKVPNAKTATVVLSDGTTVRLNAGSTLYYPKKFNETSREVRLVGEAFFKVARNARRPFLVHTDKLTIRVLGTIFNVKAYPQDAKTETTLLSGKVKVELNDHKDKEIFLLPNEKLIVDNSAIAAQPGPAHNGTNEEYEILSLPGTATTAVKETAWLEDKLIFTNDSFKEVANQLERKYDVTIVFEDSALETERISGILKNEPLEKALELFKMTTSFKFHIEGRSVFLYSNTANSLNK